MRPEQRLTGFPSWAAELADLVEREAENPREALEAEDEASRYFDRVVIPSDGMMARGRHPAPVASPPGGGPTNPVPRRYPRGTDSGGAGAGKTRHHGCAGTAANSWRPDAQ